MSFIVQVISVVKRWPGLHKISFVAHSLGGLVARYAIGRLYQLSTRVETTSQSECGSRSEANNSGHHPEQHYEARICGLEPVNFITFATPHLGSIGHKQVWLPVFSLYLLFTYGLIFAYSI